MICLKCATKELIAVNERREPVYGTCLVCRKISNVYPTLVELTVKLTYFKNTGKYYAIGDFTVPANPAPALHVIWRKVQRLADKGELPGLLKGANEFLILVDVPNHPHNHLHIMNMKTMFQQELPMFIQEALNSGDGIYRP
jgi:hypothetical protein